MFIYRRTTPDRRVVARESGLQLGFTLVEVLVVIAILTIVTTIAVIAASRSVARGEGARLVSDADAINTAATRFFTESRPNVYPVVRLEDTDASLTTFGDAGVRLIDFDSSLPQDAGQTFVPNFLKKVPKSTNSVSWRIDTRTGLVFFAGLGDPLALPAEAPSED